MTPGLPPILAAFFISANSAVEFADDVIQKFIAGRFLTTPLALVAEMPILTRVKFIVLTAFYHRLHPL